MTGNPEQTATPLSDAEVAEIRRRFDGDLTSTTPVTIMRLCDTIDSLRADTAEARQALRHRTIEKAGAIRALEELEDGYRDVVAERDEARRQRDERPAGRVVTRQVTCSISSLDGPEVSRFDGGYVDEPVGTEVAVVVLADDSAQTPEEE